MVVRGAYLMGYRRIWPRLVRQEATEKLICSESGFQLCKRPVDWCLSRREENHEAFQYSSTREEDISRTKTSQTYST